MMAPTPRLIAWTAGVLLPAAVLAGAVPDAWPAAALLAGALVAVAAADAWRGRRALAGLRAETAPVTRLSVDRPGELPLVLTPPAGGARRLALAVEAPDALGPAVPRLEVALPADAPRARVGWPCRPRRRGSFPLARVHFGALSPLGLWEARRSVALAGEARVYPHLLAERRAAAAVFLRRGRFGLHAHRQVGQGREFERLREYAPGDGYEDIAWKATARRGRPVTRVHQIERTQEVYVVLDTSRLSARPVAAGADAAGGPPAADRPALERHVNAGLILLRAAERQGDHFGLVACDQEVRAFVRARGGNAHFNACRDAVHALQPRAVSPDFRELAAFLRARLRRRALLVCFTALDDPAVAEDFTEAARLLARAHLVLVHMLRPAGVRPVFSRPEIGAAADAYAELAGHLRWQELCTLQGRLRHLGVALELLDGENFTAAAVSRYAAVKQRQAL